jgi:hypothetical protein
MWICCRPITPVYELDHEKDDGAFRFLSSATQQTATSVATSKYELSCVATNTHYQFCETIER